MSVKIRRDRERDVRSMHEVGISKERDLNTVMNANDQESPRDEERSALREGFGDDREYGGGVAKGVEEGGEG